MQDSSFKIPINIPPELITEILLRLPVKSLLQLRCVSKSWLALISSPEFIKTHLNICANNKNYTHHRLMVGLSPPEQNLKNCSVSSLLYDSVSIEAINLDYPYKNTHKFPRYPFIVGSVNGLICFSVQGTEFFPWNPSIRKFKKLPDSIGCCSFMFGFGYDELHDDYKIVGIDRYLGHDGLRHAKAKIFSVNSDSWTSVDNFQEGVVFIRSKGMFVNGKLY
uniref:F-box/kelch-repeat protein At3g23880-like n=1 Tax=Nicotiana sylvestris TaxID=4096 RepID=A0A1U7XQP5_NICSY|nr:PREDICTED: F-box/kelch-repeat protein At3g23880-like [Nicotiana sylvestris]